MEAEKKKIRDHLRRSRQRLTQDEVQGLSAAVCQQAQRLPHFQNASSIGLYLSTDNEVDPSPLLLAALQSDKAVFLPVVDRERHSVHFVPYREGDPLVVGAFGIREPLQRSPVLPCITDLDLLFLPLVAFDPGGWRLGYGGGYYDRLLARDKRATGQKPLLIGLAYPFQAVPALPHAAHDIPMDWVITDRGCLACSGT